MSSPVVPVVDLQQYVLGNPDQKEQFITSLSDAFKTIGFVAVKNHGISQTLIDDFYTYSNHFFALPVEIKEKYEIAGMAGQRGYTSFGKEHAKHSKVADLKEFFQIGQQVSDDHPAKSKYPDNVSIAEVPQFSQKAWELYQDFERVGSYLLEAIAIFLDLEPDYFAKQTREGSSILRAIHYPPITVEPASAIRAEQHEDINLITLLVGASSGGLQLQNKDGQWLDAVPEPDELMINVGDMLQRLTNNLLKSTTHRVVNPPREEWHKPRLSIPFFMHPVAEMDLTCLSTCITKDNPLQYEPTTAGEYLDERLREIGLKK